MTDEQIIKALRCWTGKTVKDEECAECSFGEDRSLGEIVDAAEKRINELASENAALRERLEKAIELPCELGSNLFTIEKHYEFITYGAEEYRIENKYCAGEIVICEDGRFCFYTPEYHPKCLVFGKDIFTTREAAEARLAELKGETK